MDIGIVVKLAGDVMADEPAIVADIAVVEAGMAKLKTLPPITDATSAVAYVEGVAEMLKAVAPLVDQIIAQVKALGITPAPAPAK